MSWNKNENKNAFIKAMGMMFLYFVHNSLKVSFHIPHVSLGILQCAVHIFSSLKSVLHFSPWCTNKAIDKRIISSFSHTFALLQVNRPTSSIHTLYFTLSISANQLNNIPSQSKLHNGFISIRSCHIMPVPSNNSNGSF